MGAVMTEYAQVIGRVEPEIKEALDKIKTDEGINIEWQLRMGLLMWLESRGVAPLKPKTDLPR